MARSLELETIVHATEDLDKVVEAVMNVLPTRARRRLRLKVKELKGHYGNPIKLLRARTRDASLASAVLRHVIASLPNPERAEVITNLERRLSGGFLFLRLDKQRAFLGEVRLCEVDPIWMKFSLVSSKPDEVRKALEEACGGHG